MEKIILIFAILFLTFSCNKNDGTVKDIDGNVYNTVKIGNQVWMAENLKTTKYRNGEDIPNVTNNSEWKKLKTGAYCNYDNNSIHVVVYGRLYNYYAVKDQRGLAPDGWHVPTDEEWTTLTTYLGGESIAGGKLKEVGTLHWISPNIGATNESGFTTLPSGFRYYDDGRFNRYGSADIFWSSNDYITGTAWSRGMLYDRSDMIRTVYQNNYGFSVRCIKD